METIAEYCLKNHKEKTDEVIKYSDMFCEHVFLFNTENDLEQVDEPIYYEKKIDWVRNPIGDPEYVYQFNRHRYWLTMGQAYALTGDEKYAEEFAYQINDWIDSNPFDEKFFGTSWRILEAGFRGEYWTKALWLFKDSPALTDELLEKIYSCMKVHCDYIVASHSPYRLISNWGVIENHGMFMMTLALPESEEVLKYRKIAIDHLAKLCQIAIMPDGVEWEQSPMYHNEVLKDILDVIMLADEFGVELPEIIKKTAYNMALADLAWIKPNHHQFMQGDSDDFDISQFLCRAAIIFNDGLFKTGARDFADYETVWDVGIQKALAYEKMQPVRPDFTSKALMESGNFYFRNDWSSESNLLHFHCGTIGAGHGHSDKLHFDLVARGEDVLMDGGRFTYVWGDKRNEYKDPTGHNTITVDGRFFTKNKDSWECSKLSEPVNQEFKSTDTAEFVQGGHLGYMDEGVYVNRKIIHIKPDIYIVCDCCYAKDFHTYQSYFHFNPEGKVELFADERKAVFTGKKSRTSFYFLRDDTELTLTDTHISRGYNQEENNFTVRADFSGEGTQTFVTVIKVDDVNCASDFKAELLPVKSALKGVIYPDYKAQGVKTTVDGREYVTTICHQEVNSPTDLVECDGCMGFGSVIVFDREKDLEGGQVLAY